MLLENGLKAFKVGRFAEAIAHLEEYCRSCEASGTVGSRNYMQAQMSLVKAHLSSGEQDKAIAICKTLLDVDNTALKIWASQTLSKLVPSDAMPTALAAPDPPNLPASSKTFSHQAPHSASSQAVSRSSSSAIRSTSPSRQFVSRQSASQPQALQPSYSIAHSGASMVGNAFIEVLFKFLIRRGLALIFLFPLWFIRGWLGGGGYSSAIPVGEVTPLHQAAGQGNIAQVQQLLAEGADINARDAEGRTPLFWSASGCVFELPHQASSAACALNSNHAQVTALLLSSGAKPDVQDIYEETPLHWAAGLGTQETAKPLLDRGANINAKDAYGTTPLAIAKHEENQDMVVYLQSLGAIE